MLDRISVSAAGAKAKQATLFRTGCHTDLPLCVAAVIASITPE